ncbi:MAG: hypothetical protein KDI09_13790 [Halioglobus sp.]|nr:hypothetical protein [Halioglobus sp.]
MTIKVWKAACMAVIGSVAALHAAPGLAAIQTQTWDFSNSSQSFSGTGFGNSLNLTSSDGVNLTITGWSDTNDVSGPDRIETAKLIWAQNSALGIQNRDEDTNSPNHSIDSITSDADGEFDMLLLQFDTAVRLTGIDLNWAVGGNAANRADVSILAYDGSGSTSLGGSTWANVLSSNGGNYDSVGNYANVGLSYYAVNPAQVESTTWLVGVYNPVFGSGGDAGDDGFKLGLITTETDDPQDDPPGEVPVPGSVPLMLLGLVLLRRRISALGGKA